jgi:ABC-type dipeptide/oligopeptide/nickel transport system permease subunit
MLQGVNRFVTHRSAVVGGVLVAMLVVLAVVGPMLARDPFTLDVDHGLSAMGAPIGPSSGALLGTDALGRDVWARVVHGAGASLTMAVLATLASMLAGVVIGVVAGYRGGRTDNLLMRFVDLGLAFPFLLLAILLAALLHQAHLESRYAPVVIPLAAVGWTTCARLVRAKALVLARSEYVLAARALGASGTRVIVHHLLPNLAGTIATVAAFTFAQNLLGEAALSFVGLGPPEPEPTWGRMLYESRAYYRTAPWMAIAPGIAILVAVAAFNLLGEGLRGAFARTERTAR